AGPGGLHLQAELRRSLPRFGPLPHGGAAHRAPCHARPRRRRGRGRADRHLASAEGAEGALPGALALRIGASGHPMRTVATIEARMASTRLPGKVLLPAAGRPMLAHLLDRLRAAPSIEQ